MALSRLSVPAVRVSVSGTARLRQSQPVYATRRSTTRPARKVAHVVNFITVDQGMKKVKHMLDFGKEKRLSILHKLYSDLTPESMNEVLADDFVMVETELEEGTQRSYGKRDYINVMTNVVLPSIPDFCWGHLTNGDIDNDGFCIVTVKASGHHTGAPFVVPGAAPIPASGGRFTLAQETHKVRVAGGKVTHVTALPSKDAGAKALYQALQQLSAQAPGSD